MSVKRIGEKWGFRIDAGRNPKTGKRKQVYRSGFKTKREAEAALAKIKLELNQGKYFEPSKQLFGDYIDYWLLNSYKNEVQITTFEKVEGVVTSHIIPFFQYFSLHEIKAFHIDQFYTEKIKTGLSPAYVKVMHNALSKAFQKAIKWELIRENPVKGVTAPTVPKTSKEVWTVEEANRFLDTCTEWNALVPFMLGIFTGMRRGEILGLKWRNIDLKKGVIYVRENLVQTRTGLILKDLKTSSSLRDVHISTTVVEVLKKYRNEQGKWKERLGKAYIDQDFVVCTLNGNPVYPRNLLRKFSETIKLAKVPKMSFHGLRHTHATILMALGENPKAIAERLGHSRVGVTLDVYSHTNQEMQRKMANRFEKGVNVQLNSRKIILKEIQKYNF
ncbi:tyrosine-type recombinase/integrase [Bacillus sp. 165]|uniref:site-specific integrase n=1 Tax=Bacillus sp. 165 TaxID=1529117 RepID=UPI001ADD56E7|nr:tyrosine-type recombinase/integrase [Bacillus sp. 165]MBO9128503.1 site-specific integrase [Bacillus sp. 165]